MSDIAIRFDGLLLVASLVAAASIYALITLVAGIAILGRNRHRLRLVFIARAAAIMCVASLGGSGVVATYLEWAGQPAAGPDLIDWLTVPVLLLFLAGCVFLVRRRPGMTGSP